MARQQAAIETPRAEAMPATRRGRGRPVGDREAQRTTLLKSSLTIIAQHGYVGASLRKIAKHAGFTTGAVSYYFENKEGMLGEASDYLFEQFENWMAGLETENGEVDPRAIFERWIGWAQGEDPDAWYSLFQLLALARHDPAFATRIATNFARYRSSLARLLAKGQEQGSVRRDIPADLLADQLTAIGDGWMMMLPIEPDRFDRERTRTLLDSIVMLIRAPAPKRDKSRLAEKILGIKILIATAAVTDLGASLV